MRMRERPWTSAATRQVPLRSVPLFETYVGVGHYKTPPDQLRTPQVTRHGRQRTGHIFRSSHSRHTGVYRQDIDLSLLKIHQKDSINNTAVKTNRFMPSRIFATDNSSQGSGVYRSSSLCQELVPAITSLTPGKKIPYHTSSRSDLSCIMTRNASTPRVPSTHGNNNCLNVWARLANDTSSTSTNNARRDVNMPTGQLYFRNYRSMSNNSRNTARKSRTKDTAKSSVKNSYRNLDETIFDLDSDKVKGDANSGVTFAHEEEETKPLVSGRLTFVATAHRRMSAPDLPPIKSSTNSKGDKRKISTNSVASTGMKASPSQPATSLSTKTNYSRRSSATTSDSWADGLITTADGQLNEKLLECRNANDSPLMNLKSSDKASDSSHNSWSPQRKFADASHSQGSEGRDGSPTERKHLTNGHKMLSLSAAEVVDSQGRLEPLFETTSNINGYLSNSFHNSSHNNDSTLGNNKIANRYHINHHGSSIKKAINNSSIASNNNYTHDIPSIARPSRSTSVNRARNPEGNSSNFNNPKKKLVREDWDSPDVDALGVIKPRGRLVRSVSENKISGKPTHCNTDIESKNNYHKEHASRKSLSRNMSVERNERLGSSYQHHDRGVTTARGQRVGNLKMRVSESAKSLYKRDRREVLFDVSNQEEINCSDEGSKANKRLVEWLRVVNNVERYETDPRDAIFDYSDDPPQTDTAIHLVYQGE